MKTLVREELPLPSNATWQLLFAGSVLVSIFMFATLGVLFLVSVPGPARFGSIHRSEVWHAAQMSWPIVVGSAVLTATSLVQVRRTRGRRLR